MYRRIRNPPPGLSPEPNAEFIRTTDDPTELVLALATENELMAKAAQETCSYTL